MKKRLGAFEFDLITRELRRDGAIVHLPAQPAQVLAALVEHAGEVVTRDTLRETIWGADTFVEFDKSLNFAIGQVRAALGDASEAPTFIRTFPKRGYQFIGAVENLDLPGTLEPKWRRALALRNRSPNRLRQGVGGQEGLRHNRLLRGALAAAVVALAAVSAGWIWNARRSPTPILTIAVTPFDNQTGLADYDGYAQNVTDALVAELTASGTGRFAIIGNAAVLRVPRERRDIVAIGDALKAGYIILGQVQRDGPRVRVLAHLIRLPEQTHLWVTRVEAAPSDQSTTPTGLADRITREFLSKL